MNKRRLWHAKILLLLLLSVFLFAGRVLLSTLTLIAVLVLYLFERSVEKQTRQRTRELQERIDALENTNRKEGAESPSHPPLDATLDVCARFAGGLAHDFNNILSGLVTFPELILMDLPEDSPLVKPLNAMMRSGKKASDLVTQLVAVSKGTSGHSLVINANTKISDYLTSDEGRNLTRQWPDLDIETDLAPDLFTIDGVPEHLDTIIRNLVTQARESILGEGRLWIRSENLYVDVSLNLSPETVPPGEYVCLTVADNGPPLSEEDRARIFEPYYCKKVLQRSCSGLGMTMVWNMVKSAGGYISAHSDPAGTSYRVYLPAGRKTADHRSTPEPDTEKVSLGDKRILVIDDDALQRDIASEILTRAGYETHTVASGEEAVDFLEKYPVDLIVLDMIMTPGINGYETYRRILSFAPAQKAIIASGFVRSDEMEKVRALGAGAYVRKPYTVGRLLEAVSAELSKTPG